MMESEFVKKKKEKKDESMDLSCLASMVQATAGGVMLWGIILWHTLGFLLPTAHHFKVLLLTVFIPLEPQCTHLPITASSRIMQNSTKFSFKLVS